MNNPDKVAECVYEIKQSCDLPVSIKTRLGLGYEENLDLLFTLINKTKSIWMQQVYNSCQKCNIKWPQSKEK